MGFNPKREIFGLEIQAKLSIRNFRLLVGSLPTWKRLWRVGESRVMLGLIRPHYLSVLISIMKTQYSQIWIGKPKSMFYRIINPMFFNFACD